MKMTVLDPSEPERTPERVQTQPSESCRQDSYSSHEDESESESNAGCELVYDPDGDKDQESRQDAANAAAFDDMAAAEEGFAPGVVTDHAEPCPFCASGDLRGMGGRSFNMDFKKFADYYQIVCDGCKAEGPHGSTPEEAVQLWNDKGD